MERVKNFDDFFKFSSKDLLVVCTYSQLLFLDNRNREKVLLRVKYSDIIYVMGKENRLKISMIINKQKTAMD